LFTIKDWISQQQQQAPNRQAIATNVLRQLLAAALNKNSAWLFAHPDHPLTVGNIQQLDEWLSRLKTGEPLAYITGQQAFWDLTLQVNPHTLIPRPDSEILIETAVSLYEKQAPERVLDLGTGSGALALALARVFPQATILATDQSAPALEMASKNARINRIKQVTFLQSDWFEHIPAQKFDLIVSNPPYLATDDEHLEALQHEPTSALVAGEQGLSDFLDITSRAPDFLSHGGILMFEHGWQQQQAVADILAAGGFQDIGFAKDLAGHDRVTWGRLQKP